MNKELILIVEDNDKNRKLVRDVLAFKGYRTLESESAEEGIRLAREFRPALILMDAAGLIQDAVLTGFSKRGYQALSDRLDGLSGRTPEPLFDSLASTPESAAGCRARGKHSP